MLDQFQDLESYYPGSRERRQTVPRSRPPAVEEDPLGQGIIMVLRGRNIEFFTIGQVARAIGRKSGTMRTWEDKGIIPPSGYRKPSPDPRGVRRLYTRDQCTAIIEAAKATGVMNATSRRPLHEFSRLVWAAFNELKGGSHARPSQGSHR